MAGSPRKVMVDGVQDYERGGSPFVAFFTSPLVWGAVLTVGFYSFLPKIPSHQEFLQRYFCGHWVLYATTSLFFVGISILGKKGCGIFRERAAFSFRLLQDPRLAQSGDIQGKAETLAAIVASLPRRIQGSILMRRYRDVCDYLRPRPDPTTLEEHLKYLADIEADKLHDSYSLVRTITWAVPILGFLGTVIGITMAITNITPDQLESSLPEVTAGLGVAFDTTALSLSLSMVLVFLTFLMERTEQSILADIEQVGIRQLASLFVVDNSPLKQAEQLAAHQLLAESEGLISRHVGLWNDSLSGLNQRLQQTLSLQQGELVEGVRSGIRSTLSAHDDHLREMREGFLQETGMLIRELVSESVTHQKLIREQQSDFSGQLAALWQGVQQELRQLQVVQQQETVRLMGAIESQMSNWQGHLEQTNSAITSQLRVLQEQGAILRDLAGDKQDLLKLQESLAQNLEVLRSGNSFEEAIHSLTAAIHLITARNQPGRVAA